MNSGCVDVVGTARWPDEGVGMAVVRTVFGVEGVTLVTGTIFCGPLGGIGVCVTMWWLSSCSRTGPTFADLNGSSGDALRIE